MKLLFLGTGASDWNGPDERGEYRRHASALLDGCLLIDVTQSILDSIPDPAGVTDVFFTHSHDDHFDLEALKTLAPCRVYAHESWAECISGNGLTVIPLQVGVPVQAAGFTMTPMPSNHYADRENETTLHYLIEKDGKRLLYATDGGWLTTRENQIIGNRTLDAIVFDATVGEGYADDFQIFHHNSVDMIRLMCASLRKTGRLQDTAPVFLTHLSRTLHAPQAVLEQRTEKPMIACYDGLEVTI